jgi:folate-binding protein YgfZ
MTLTESEIEAMAARAGLVDRSDRVRLEVSGPDRAKFLHNLTTNDVKRLAIGRGCEAFVTSLQGKTIGYVTMHAADDRIIVRTDPGGWQPMEPHWQKYGVFEDARVVDSTPATFELHLMGASAADILSQAGAQVPHSEPYAHAPAEIGGSPVRIIRESPAGLAGLTVIGALDSLSNVCHALDQYDGPGPICSVDQATFDALRIEAGTPVFGRDVTDKNLPQEIGRDDRAINFVKGCYLGQETVARIDALGHVNQLLKGLQFEPQAVTPAAGWELVDGSKRVGVITSAAFSPVRRAVVALALIRTTHAQPGTRLAAQFDPESVPANAIVRDLPFPRDS